MTDGKKRTPLHRSLVFWVFVLLIGATAWIAALAVYHRKDRDALRRISADIQRTLGLQD